MRDKVDQQEDNIVNRIEKLHRRSAGRRPPRPKDTRRQYRAGRESKAYRLPQQTEKGGKA